MAAGATQAAVWQQNAAAWAERLGRQYPLYRDLVQVGAREAAPRARALGKGLPAEGTAPAAVVQGGWERMQRRRRTG